MFEWKKPMKKMIFVVVVMALLDAVILVHVRHTLRVALHNIVLVVAPALEVVLAPIRGAKNGILSI